MRRPAKLQDRANSRHGETAGYRESVFLLLWMPSFSNFQLSLAINYFPALKLGEMYRRRAGERE